MTKVTQQAGSRPAPADAPTAAPAGGDSSDEPEGAEPLDEALAAAPEAEDAGGDDLKATVTLSGEALAALLEEVKAAQKASAPLPPVETSDAGDDGGAVPRRGPQRRSGKT